jgi:prophage antirepressor-like protein
MMMRRCASHSRKFDFHGASVRTVMIKGEPWFVAGDVCKILGIENGRDAISRIKNVNVGSTDVENSRGQLRKTKIVNESGLYRLIFQSRKPEAERFTDWVTGEVLPQIRKTGRYSKDVSPWLSTHPSQWHKTFPDAYFLQIFRLKGKRPPKDGNLKRSPCRTVVEVKNIVVHAIKRFA